MAAKTVYSTPPSNAAWFRRLGSGDGKVSLPELQKIRTAGQEGARVLSRP